MYTAVRLMSEDKALGPAIFPTRSMVAGCSRAVPFAKALLIDLLSHVKRRYEDMAISSWIDDLNTRVEGSVARIKKVLFLSSKAIVEGLRALDLVVSPKSLFFI